MPRLRLDLAYQGTDFQGWQLQAPGQRTIQGCLEEALARLAGIPDADIRTGKVLRVFGAGRTDSGVHALGQVAHVDIPESRIHLPWRRALNALLPPDIAVLEAAIVDNDFHSRVSARSKIYAYHLWLEPDFVLPQRRAFVWRCGELDVESMRMAAPLFCGRHDFKSFQNVGTEVEDTVRVLNAITFAADPSGRELVLRFQGEGFLKQMVRNLVGCLVAVGKGKLEPQAIPDLLTARDRSQAPATAPACGLTLERVIYC